MFSTGIVYLAVAYDESGELSEEGELEHQKLASAQAEQFENEEAEMGEHDGQYLSDKNSDPDKSEEGVGPFFETIFFSSVGVAYFPIGLWLILKKEATKPYVIAMIGSASLIAFYVATRTMNLPFIGLQDDVGTLDIASKILQGMIVVLSAFAIAGIIREKRKEKLA